MKLWLLVPVKPLSEGKSRLATFLSADERAALIRRLLTHVLLTSQTAGVLAGVIVVSRDRGILAQAAHAGAEPLLEHGHELNTALTQARTHALTHGADAILVLPADLPLLTPADVRQIYEQGQRAPCVVIAPSRDGGTGALLLHPPHAINFAFGEGSFARHRAQAQAAGLACHVYRTPTLAFDLDQWRDWEEWQRILAASLRFSSIAYSPGTNRE